MGRKLSKTRPKQGSRLAKLRRAAGLSQAELGELIGEAQQNIAYWEQSDKPPRSDALPALAEVLGVKVEQFFDDSPVPKVDLAPGRVRKVFLEVSKLPKRQQEKVLEFIMALVDQYKRSG